MKLSIDQVAEAMELNQKGVYWSNIALILGVSRMTLMRYVYGAERYGYSFWEKERLENNDGLRFAIEND